MNVPFFYEPYNEAGSLQLSDANRHYILQVLRMKDGEQCFITNGKGTKCLAVIRDVSKRDCSIEIVDCFTQMPRQSNLHIAISFTKNPSRMEWFLEKATELGIETITPLVTHRSEKNFFKKERFEKILISAMLQSQQTFLPHLNDISPLKSVIEATAPQKYIAYCGDEYEKQKLADILRPSVGTLFLIGPEGDFTADEVSLCRQKKCEVIELGTNRLRTETAGLYVCTFFNAIQ